jgi:hypothetical protein
MDHCSNRGQGRLQLGLSLIPYSWAVGIGLCQCSSGREGRLSWASPSRPLVSHIAILFVVQPNYDRWVEESIMARVGCRPPYWDHVGVYPNCTTREQLKLLGKHSYST